ncbi:hypothetical protein [Ruegeria faecimaris]|uniref:DUF4177 domain-containing protein n=1 Tax=Ruegeria faecimaris TaxID=686389 RepID=A0A521EHM1_9RHOB|nr:hypothetical protein [Ruegeria faecimaris]SMO83424.1 hypothetical protein SAMN06265380_11168 [Ruegeria faecimaris]
MKKFEYRNVLMRVEEKASVKFAELGQDGWEMVGVVPAEFGIVCFFKRELTDG